MSNMPGFNISTPIIPNIVNQNIASEFYKRIIIMINDFEKDLNNEYETGIRLVTFGQSVSFHITEIGYSNPSLICFYGVLEDGSAVKLVQHVSQISFLLMAMKRSKPEEPKKKIGFIENVG